MMKKAGLVLSAMLVLAALMPLGHTVAQAAETLPIHPASDGYFRAGSVLSKK